MVSDFHHLFPSSVVINKARSNFPYVEVNYNKCKLFCRHSKCSTIIPTHPDDYNCITHDKMFMPRLDNRGRIARAVLYFFTMYKDDMSMVGDLRTFLKWNRENPPTRKEFHRNNKINKTQGNRNPYIDDYRLADKAWDYD